MLSTSLDGFIAGAEDGPGKPLGIGGQRLLDQLMPGGVQLELVCVVDAPGSTHLTYRVVK